MGKKTSSDEMLLARLSGRQKAAKKYLPKRTGKRKHKIARYYATVNQLRKLRHVLKRNGVAAARRWADERDVPSLFKRLIGE